MKKIVITGVTSGIGRALLLRLNQEGHHVIGVARSKEKLEQLKPLLKTPFDLIQADLSQTKEVIKAAILSILYDENDYNVVVTSDVDPKDQSLCKLALQVCKDTLCSTPNSPISVCDKHVTSTSKL